MSLIIPYDSSFGSGDGAFIRPNNEIILTNGMHELVSALCCCGRDCLFGSKSDDSLSWSKLTNEQLGYTNFG